MARYRGETIIPAVTAGEAAEYLNIRLPETTDPDEILSEPVSFGEIIDLLESGDTARLNRDQSFTLKATVGELISLLGEDHIRDFVRQKTG